MKRSAATVPLTDRAVREGLSLFETVRVARGRPLQWPAHRARLARALRDWRWPAPRGWGEIDRLISRILRRHPPAREATLRVTVTGGGEGPGWAPHPPGSSRLYLEVLPSRRPSVAVYRRGVGVVCLPRGSADSTGFSRWKVGSRAMQTWSRHRARRRGAFECLLLDSRGGILEGTRSNVAAVKGRVIRTPRLAPGGLPGTVRALLPVLALRCGYRWREARLTARMVQRADEAFLTNALIGVLAVSRLDGRRIGTGRAGPCARALQAALERGEQAC
ncbi:MAG: aminotransferase class IV [Planctomycetes bacterium]|nr:aminotransferase class IV [Planctomycetota bacterium]